MFPCLPLLCIVFLFLSAWFITFRQTLTNYLLNWVLWKGALKLIYKLCGLGQGGSSHRARVAGVLQITHGFLARKTLRLGRGEGQGAELCLSPKTFFHRGKSTWFFFFSVDNSLEKWSIREVNQYANNPTPDWFVFPFKESSLLCICLSISLRL